MTPIPYASKGNSLSDQAEASSESPTAGNWKIRVLVELQLQSYMMAQEFGIDEDLQELRQSIADSIT